MIAQTVSPVIRYEILIKHFDRGVPTVISSSSFTSRDNIKPWEYFAGFCASSVVGRATVGYLYADETMPLGHDPIGTYQWDECENVVITRTDPYANLPTVGGGAHAADELTPEEIEANCAAALAQEAAYKRIQRAERARAAAATNDDRLAARVEVDAAYSAMTELRSKPATNRATLQGPDNVCKTCGNPYDVNLTSVSFCSSCQLAKNDSSDPLYCLALAHAPQDETPTHEASVGTGDRVGVAEPLVGVLDLSRHHNTTTNRATSQKRDNQRAERNAAREAYDAHAWAQVDEISDMLKGMGFSPAARIDREVTLVFHWSNGEAIIKQTPYTIKVYNGQPARLRTHGDAELVNRMEHGWCQRGEATGYAAGIVAALLPLIETPDPYMQALDAMEAELCPACDNPTPRDAVCADCGRMNNHQEDEEEPPANAYTLAVPSHEGGMQTIMAVSRYDLPAISGGSQEADDLQPLTEGAFRLYNGLTVGHPRRRQWLTGYRNGQDERASTEISEKNKAHFVTALAAMMRVYARNGWEAPQHDTPDDLYHRAGRFFGLVSTLDTERCPGFFSSQAGATLDCENFKTTRAEYCDECQKANKREEQREMEMAHLDQWAR